jgi:hypothetical protein
MSNENLMALCAELFRRIDQLEKTIADLESSGPPPFQWTGSKVALTELLYAMQASGVLNNGSIGIKETAQNFEKIFQTDLGNYYHCFNEIRLRKKNRTALLDLLREKVIQKMDGLDEG